MADDWLQRYLNARLLDIGDDDVKLEFLRKAARDIGQHLVEHAADVPRFTLVALDPDVPPDEPVLEQAEDVIIKHWNTLRGRYSDRPRQLIRAVLLEALSLAGGEDDPRFAAIIALTGTSFLPRVGIAEEAEVLTDFLAVFRDKAETYAAEHWSASIEELPRLSTPLIKAQDLPEETSINEEQLRKELAAAAGPQDNQSTDLKNPNPHWPQNGPNWSYQFAPRAADAIATAIDTALREQAAGQAKALESLLRDHAKAVRAAVKDVMEFVAATAEVEQRRTTVLWWLKTLYSPSTQVTYRTFAPEAAALLMAVDLANIILPHTPVSVEHVLREAVREILPRSSDQPRIPEFSVLEFCEVAIEEVPDRRVLGDSVEPSRGRVPLSTYVFEAMFNGVEAADNLQRRTGLEPDTRVRLDDLAVWLFRDIQAGKLAAADDAS